MADITEDLRSGALFYHRYPKPGKVEIQPTKPLGNQRDLALAYSPGVAIACTAIADDPAEAANLTVPPEPRRRGLERHGRAGPRQYRPARLQARDGGQGGSVQEIRRDRRLRHRGRGDGRRPAWSTSWRRWSRPSAASTSKTSRRPSASRSRSSCKARMGIPVFHDDQHGTAIIVGAAVVNALEFADKRDRRPSRWSPRAPARRHSPASTCS